MTDSKNVSMIELEFQQLNESEKALDLIHTGYRMGTLIKMNDDRTERSVTYQEYQDMLARHNNTINKCKKDLITLLNKFLINYPVVNSYEEKKIFDKIEIAKERLNSNKSKNFAETDYILACHELLEFYLSEQKK